MENKSNFLDAEIIGKLLNVSRATIRKFLKNGILKGKKIGKKWYMSSSDLDEYFSKKEIK